MANVLCPSGFPAEPPGLRSGLPARSYLGAQLSEQQLFLEAAFKGSRSFWVADSETNGLGETDATSSDPLLFRLNVPPFTRWVAWRVLTSGRGDVYAKRTGSSRQMKITVQDTPRATSYRNAAWFFAWTTKESGSDEAVAIDVDNNTGAWTKREIQVWLDSSYSSRKVEIWAVEFQYLRLVNDGSDIIST